MSDPVGDLTQDSRDLQASRKPREPLSHDASTRERPRGTRVRDIMSEKVVTISAGDRLSTVEDIMTLGHVRHMPVVRSGQLVGVVSERDLLRASLSNLTDFGSEHRRAFLHAVEINRVMSSPPIVIPAEASVEEAALVMAEKKIGCLTVVQGDALVGMLTETDVLRYFARVDG
jgi:CBS domain-containing protein